VDRLDFSVHGCWQPGVVSHEQARAETLGSKLELSSGGQATKRFTLCTQFGPDAKVHTLRLGPSINAKLLSE